MRFWMIATSFTISSAVNSPARLLTSISAFLQIRSVKRRPRPLIFVRPNTTFRFPSTFVLRIRRMCWNSAPCINEVDLEGTNGGEGGSEEEENRSGKTRMKESSELIQKYAAIRGFIYRDLTKTDETFQRVDRFQKQNSCWYGFYQWIIDRQSPLSYNCFYRLSSRTAPLWR